MLTQYSFIYLETVSCSRTLQQSRWALTCTIDPVSSGWRKVFRRTAQHCCPFIDFMFFKAKKSSWTSLEEKKKDRKKKHALQFKSRKLKAESHIKKAISVMQIETSRKAFFPTSVYYHILPAAYSCHNVKVYYRYYFHLIVRTRNIQSWWKYDITIKFGQIALMEVRWEGCMKRVH